MSAPLARLPRDCKAGVAPMPAPVTIPRFEVVGTTKNYRSQFRVR